MAKKILANTGAFLLLVAFGALMAPACTIHFSQGGEGGTEGIAPAPDDTQPTPDDTEPAPDDTPPRPRAAAQGAALDSRPRSKRRSTRRAGQTR
ncbi:hypothetical protein [Sorangium sp. So ce362]|uniref:hypothetical protein n=1 Tax=Sorangium sp. So ce362 TaxID=3133303 RepID=UPI003F603A82